VANGNPHPESDGGAPVPGSHLRTRGLRPLPPHGPGGNPHPHPLCRGWWGPWVGAVGVRFLPNSPRLDGPNTGYRRDGAWLHVWGYLTLLLDLSSNCEVAWTGKPNETNTHRVCATRFSGSDLAFLARCAWACGIHSGVTVVFV